jgi:hypothetical protein
MTAMENNILNTEQEKRGLEEENNEGKASSDEPQQNENPENIISKISKVMQRDNWGAQPPKSITMLNIPVSMVFVTL